MSWGVTPKKCCSLRPSNYRKCWETLFLKNSIKLLDKSWRQYSSKVGPCNIWIVNFEWVNEGQTALDTLESKTINHLVTKNQRMQPSRNKTIHKYHRPYSCKWLRGCNCMCNPNSKCLMQIQAYFRLQFHIRQRLTEKQAIRGQGRQEKGELTFYFKITLFVAGFISLHLEFGKNHIDNCTRWSLNQFHMYFIFELISLYNF